MHSRFEKYILEIAAATLEHGGVAFDLNTHRFLPPRDTWSFPKYPARTTILPPDVDLVAALEAFIEENGHFYASRIAGWGPGSTRARDIFTWTLPPLAMILIRPGAWPWRPARARAGRSWLCTMPNGGRPFICSWGFLGSRRDCHVAIRDNLINLAYKTVLAIPRCFRPIHPLLQSKARRTRPPRSR